MPNVVRYQSKNEVTDRYCSPAIWLPIDRVVRDDPSRAAHKFDDFDNFTQHISAQNVQEYASYIDTGVTLTQLAAADLSEGEYGVLEVAGNDADNDEGSITAGGNTGVMGMISNTAAQAKYMAFECRMKKASIADNALSFFIGMAEEGLAAADTLVNDTGEVASKDLIGFQCLAAAGETVAAIHRKAGGAKVSTIADMETLVADTWVKLGFRYDPSAPIDKRIAFFVNGVEQSTYVTSAAIEAATFPDGEELTFLFATKVGADAESKAQLDWWRFGQLL